jgi:predicted glycogen debranching enzyme
MLQESRLEIGRRICGDLETAERREWLVTNGLGGFACGTVAGMLTRRYHGLLVAALNPPLARTLLVTAFEEIATYLGARYELAANRWRDGTVAPRGFAYIERFTLDGTVPAWEYALADALLEKRIWMEHGSNVTYVRYTHRRGHAPVKLTLRALANYRDFHSTTQAGEWRMNVARFGNGVRVEAFAGARPFFIASDGSACTPLHDWYRGFRLASETERGLDDLDDHLCVAEFDVLLEAGASVAFAASDGSLDPGGADASLERLRAREADLAKRWENACPESERAPAWLRRCVLAADQFVVARPLPAAAGALSVIAGYPWFGDWGRDTMIALAGLTLRTGRAEVAREILTTYAAYVEGGMLPNYFPDAGEAPEYNTADGALWFVQAVAAYVAATSDLATLRELFPVLDAVVRAYCDGTRFGIHVDPADGLVCAGEPGVQLTWMDAKVGDWVVTPRIGKPIEIAALWYNALRQLAALAPRAGIGGTTYAERADAAAKGFERFWNAERGYCYDVLDGPEGNDPSLRPNQLLALSLPYSALAPERGRAIVRACAEQLFASTGMRSLAADDSRYIGAYRGSPRERDAAYHQGTSWLWLLPVFATAYARAFNDEETARGFLDVYGDALERQALGTLGEIADGDPPFTPRGAFAQAWSVGEAIRAWHDAPRFARDE